MATGGHLLKSRAGKTTVRNSVFIDLSATSSANQIECPVGGEALIENNVIFKGPMAQNPHAVLFNSGTVAGELLWTDTNVMTVRNNVIVVEAITGGGNYLSVAAVGHYYARSPGGLVGSSVSMDRNQIFLSPGGVRVVEYNSPPSPIIDTNTTILAQPPVMPLGRAWLSGSLFWDVAPIYRHKLLGGSDFANFDGTQQVPDRMELRLSGAAPVGTVVCSIDAFVDPYITPDPFGPGNVWAIIFDHTKNWSVFPGAAGGAQPWAPAGMFAITTNGDGTVTLTKNQASIPAGLYFVQLRVTAPDGVTRSDSRYPIVVT
jgi:hypothetical protein